MIGTLIFKNTIRTCIIWPNLLYREKFSTPTQNHVKFMIMLWIQNIHFSIFELGCPKSSMLQNQHLEICFQIPSHHNKGDIIFSIDASIQCYNTNFDFNKPSFVSLCEVKDPKNESLRCINLALVEVYWHILDYETWTLEST